MNLQVEQVQEVVEFARGLVFCLLPNYSYGSFLEAYGILSAIVELAQADRCYNRWHLRLLLLPCWKLQKQQCSVPGPSTLN